jgi:hypothetical protein
MTVESVTYISDLNPSYPAAGDVLTEGDDHIRNIKTALKTNTFPNISGQVTLTHTQINDADLLSANQTISGNKTLTGANVLATGTITVTKNKLVSSVGTTLYYMPMKAVRITSPGSGSPTVSPNTLGVTVARNSAGNWTVTHGMGTSSIVPMVCAYESSGGSAYDAFYITNITSTTFDVINDATADKQFILYITSY